MKTVHKISAIGSLALAGLVASQVAWSNSPEIDATEIDAAQKVWGEGVVAIGQAYTQGGDYKALAVAHVDSLYAYDEGVVLFKPTKAAEDQFRGSEEEAVSYFVTGSVAEDKGFAINPWTAVRFENEAVLIEDDQALAMGNYFFTDPSGQETKVEYSFGYVKTKDDRLLINLHHSSLPYATK